MAGEDQRGGGGWWPEPEGDRPEQQPPEKPRRPPRGLESENAPRPGARYSMFVGLAFIAIILVALFNLLGVEDRGITGVGEVEGEPLAEFSVPAALGGLEGDANVAQDDCESSRNPCPEGEKRIPACLIPAAGGDAIRVCDLFDRPLAISFWFTRGGDCGPSQDAFDEVAADFEGRVNFLSVNVRDERETVVSTIEDRGWETVPVGLDPDGAVSNVYQVGVCPTIVLAYPGGILHRAEVKGGNYDSGEIGAMIEDLLEASRERALSSR